MPHLMALPWRQRLLSPWSKPVLAVLCLAPALQLVALALADALGANPAENLIRSTGDWALRMLCLTLAITPLRVLTQTPQLARFRRMLGLFTFFYAVLHALCYLWFDMGFEVGEVLRDITKRPFILVGVVAFVLLLILAGTSFHAAVRWLGAKRWQGLHRAVYAIAPLVILHFYWMRAGKRLWGEVWFYAAVLGLLLLWRVWARGRKNRVLAPRPRHAGHL